MHPTTPKAHTSPAVQAPLSIQASPGQDAPQSPLPGSPMPAHCPSLAEQAYIEAPIQALTKEATLITSFLNPFETHYEANKTMHLAKLSELRIQLSSLAPLDQAQLESVLKSFKTERITFMFHDTLLDLLASLHPAEDSRLKTFSDSIHTASESSWEILNASLDALIQNRRAEPNFLRSFQFCSIRSAALHQFLSYDNKEMQQDHFLRYQNALTNLILGPNFTDDTKAFLQKELQVPLVQLCLSNDLAKATLDHIQQKLLRSEELLTPDLQNTRYLKTKNANNQPLTPPHDSPSIAQYGISQTSQKPLNSTSGLGLFFMYFLLDF